MTIGVWTYDDYKNNFGVKHKFPKYFKEGFGLLLHNHFYVISSIPRKVLQPQKYHQNSKDVFGITGINVLTHLHSDLTPLTIAT